MSPVRAARREAPSRPRCGAYWKGWWHRRAGHAASSPMHSHLPRRAELPARHREPSNYCRLCSTSAAPPAHWRLSASISVARNWGMRLLNSR